MQDSKLIENYIEKLILSNKNSIYSLIHIYDNMVKRFDSMLNFVN